MDPAHPNEEETGEKLVITMPFNNDLTFPVALHRTETVGNLRKRIADVIGVDPSRVLLNKPTPMLRHDETVGDVAQDNRLQLIVRSAFDFERLRRLIEEDSYTPIPAPELELARPGGLASPDLSGGSAFGSAFPWRAPILSPQRSTRRVRMLKIQLNSHTTLTFDCPNEFLHQEDTLQVSPELYGSIKKLLIPDPPPHPFLAAREMVAQLAMRHVALVYQNFMELHQRGFLRDSVLAALMFALTPYVFKKFTAHPYVVSVVLLFQVAFLAHLCLRVAHLPEDFHIDWVGVVGLPDIFTEAREPEDLLALIPQQYKHNTATDEQAIDRVVGAMRRHVSMLNGFKVLAISLVPPLYQEWKVRTEAQLNMHRRAARMAAERARDEQERKQLELEPEPEPEPESESRAAEDAPTNEEHTNAEGANAQHAQHAQQAHAERAQE